MCGGYSLSCKCGGELLSSRLLGVGKSGDDVEGHMAERGGGDDLLHSHVCAAVWCRVRDEEALTSPTEGGRGEGGVAKNGQQPKFTSNTL